MRLTYSNSIAEPTNSVLASWDGFQNRGTAEGAASTAPRVLIIGLGNPILGDDGVGWSVARQIAEALGSDAGVEVDCLAVGGLSLMERMLGYRHVVLIDSIATGRSPIGAVSVMELEELPEPGLGHSASAHDASLITALQAALTMGADVPERVDIVAVETAVGLDFTETLSSPVAAAIPFACQKVLEVIEQRRQ